MQLILEELHKKEEGLKLARSLTADWREEILNSGPGTIDLRLERLTGDADTAREMSFVIDLVQASASRLGESISEEKLNANYGIPGVRFHGYSVKRLVNVLDRLRGLVEVALA